MLEKFDLLRRLNEELLNSLSDYGENNNAWEAHFMQGLTLRQCLAILYQVKEEILTDDNHEVLKQTKSKMRVADIKKNLEIQIQHHSEIRTFYAYFINTV